MKLEKLSEKEIEILEALTGKNYPGVKQIAKKTGSEYKDIFEVIYDIITLLKSFRSSRMQKEMEDKILEAICNKGCKSIKSVSDVTGIRYREVRRIISDANLLPELKEMRRKEDYEKVRVNYREGMTIKELVKITGLKYKRVRIARREDRIAEKKLVQEQRNLAGILHQIILKRAEKEDPIFYEAYAYYTMPYIKTSFEEVYRRFKDISEGYSGSECARRWNMSREASLNFIRYARKHTFHQ